MNNLWTINLMKFYFFLNFSINSHDWQRQDVRPYIVQMWTWNIIDCEVSASRHMAFVIWEIQWSKWNMQQVYQNRLHTNTITINHKLILYFSLLYFSTCFFFAYQCSFLAEVEDHVLSIQWHLQTAEETERIGKAYLLN